MSRYTRFVLVMLALLAGFGGARATDPETVTLEDCIALALTESYQIKRLHESILWAERNLWAARAGYRTYAQSRFYAPTYSEGQRLVEGVTGNPVAKEYGSLQVRGLLDLVQPLPWVPWGGGSLTFRSEAYRLNSWTPSSADPDIELKSSQFYSALSLIIDKPLFTINQLRLGLERAELTFKRQTGVYKRSELDLVYQVTQAFYQLYSAGERLAITREKVTRQEGIYNTTRVKYQAGLIAEVDAMQAEVELLQSRNELEQAQGRLLDQEAALQQLIGVPRERRLRPHAVPAPQHLTVDVGRAVALALANRSEIDEKKIDIEEQEISVSQVDDRVSIKGNLHAYYDLSGFSDPGLGWGTTTADLFSSSWDALQQTHSRGIAFELEVPLWDWGRNAAEVEAARARLRQDRLELDDLYITIEREVRNTVRMTEEAWARLELLEQSRAVSERSFEISLQRFSNGDITSTELDRANEQLSESRFSYLAALIDYKLAVADLSRKTLYDFEVDRPLVEPDGTD